MKPSHEPERADQTLLPPATASGDTSEHAADPGATLVPGRAAQETAAVAGDGTEATLLPSSANESGTVGESADPGATVARPVGGDTMPPDASRPTAPATGTVVDRFALLDLHATGGLGEVFKARDTELNREVALKRIKSRHADDPGSRRRFLSEAQLTARLDHPGVVPVFGLVNDARGRPCYAMRFIRGETLKDEIDRYHGQGVGSQESEKTEEMAATGAENPGSPGPAPAPRKAADVPRTVAFRHLLSRFIATCQAVGYAHSRNIIHRDIKPANIMVGSFGETLVVDWGLAKSLGDGPDPDRLVRAGGNGAPHDPEVTDLPSHVTQAGTVVGTPAYMAPEQAAGDLASVGPAADVYSLGATLYAILTGRAPLAGKTVAEVLGRAVKGEYEPASEVNPEAPRPLEAVCQKAMALRPEDRYATALELAADVERWLSDEPVSCYRDPLPARLARWARRHPALVAAGVSLLFDG